MYTEQDVSRAWQLINQASTITLLTHYKPDADGISACAALARVLERMGKAVEAIYPSKPDAIILRQPTHVLIKSHSRIPELLIACDTASYDRLYYPDVFKQIPLINIDHHVSNDIQGAVNLVNPASSSTCEEVFGLLKQWDPTSIDTYINESLLFGTLYDTQVFCTTSTTPRTLRLAADMMDGGAKLLELRRELYPPKSPQVLKLWGSLLANLSVSHDGTVAWSALSSDRLKQFDLPYEVLDGFSNFLAEMLNTDVTIVFSELGQNKTKVSLRSKVYNVNALAEKFGGGGHKNASGILSDIPLKDLIDLVIAAL